MGPHGRGGRTDRVSLGADAVLPGNPDLLPATGPRLRTGAEIPPRPCPYLHRGHARPIGSPVLPEDGLGLHHIVPHALPRIPQTPRVGARVDDVPLPAVVPRAL